MAEGKDGPGSLLTRRVSRRGVIGGSLAAASLAVTYAALTDPWDLLGGESVRGDADAIKRESVKVSHLLRRSGFGVTREEHDYYQSLGLEGTLDVLLNPSRVDDSETEWLISQIPPGPGGRANATLIWLTRMANTKRPLPEKMTLFWHGLLTSQLSVVRDPDAMLVQNQFFREHAFDAFPAILRGISTDPAMMVYLNVDGSNRTSPNENYARELMELFALGEGNYSEQDVREAARAFTGWQVPQQPMAGGTRKAGEPVFRPQRFDGGTKTFLGRTGNFRPEDIVNIIAEQPAAAAHVTRRLFSFFVYPEPAERALKPFVAEYEKSGGNIGTVVEAILRSDVFYSPKAYRSIVKSPLEYSIGALKALGMPAIAPLLVAGAGPRGGVLANMGQIPFEPPNVAGWPGNATWLNSATMFARLNLLNLATSGGLG
ncbi:MAG TPA: DUF1800 domain-containing protein, partial [Dehalococcoidia bacterium]|nr:DUF1800 domain-containing protein [Dehalococcoidia bacterium]